jgi:hypothetical protein
MQWVKITSDYVRSFCGRYVILLHVGSGWCLYDSDEFVDSFDTLNSAQLTAEQMMSAGWEI